MTDHRVTDLLYGHLGEASYDVDEQRWYFSSQPGLESSIQPLQSFQEYIPASQRVPQNPTRTASNIRQSRERWLRKALPEAGPAKATITSMTKTANPTLSAQHPSNLLAVGKAANVDRMTGTRSIQIMGMVHGEARNFLRLVKPRVEALKWDRQHDTKLRSLNPVGGEYCDWSGSGGPIQQITFGTDGDGPTSWLAVLKAESITILRPVYGLVQSLPSISTDCGGRCPPSHLNPNPILSLSNQQTGSRPHAHVSFNPWYVRQFAIMDQKGYWSVWDIEGQERKRITFEAKPGKFGHIQDDSSPVHGLESHDSADGWGQVLWAGGVSTLVLCDRRNFAVFDIKAAPKRLHTPEIVHAKSMDWVLDMKRSPVNLKQIFILTTKQVFWLQIGEEGENRDENFGYAGAKILLSCQHFMNFEDEAAKLEVMGENEVCNVLLYTAQSPLVNTYRFSMALGEPAKPICSQGSFNIEPSNRNQIGKDSGLAQSLCLLSTTFMLHNLKPLSGQARRYADHDVRFYQLFALSERLGLYHAFCATKWISPTKSSLDSIKYHKVSAPMIKDPRVGKIKSSLHVVEDQFIVPDGFEEEYDTVESSGNVRYAQPKSPPFTGYQKNTHDNVFHSVDASRLYKASFLEKGLREFEGLKSRKEHQTMVQYCKAVQFKVEEIKNDGNQGLLTLLELVEHTSFSEDIDEAAATLRKLMDALGSDPQTAGRVTAIPLAISPSTFIQSDIAIASVETMSDLSDIYDKLIELWVSCLPRQTPGPTRLLKEKLVRGVAAELCLSSLGVFIRDKYVVLPKRADLREDVDFILPVRTKADSSGVLTEKSLDTSSAVMVSSLPTQTSTPYLPSIHSTTSLREPVEDGAISRLRGYTSSIKSHPPLGASRSTVLAHWPSTPGINPSKYSWEASRNSIAENEDIDIEEDEALSQQREKDRRRRRTEKFLKRQRVDTMDTASQPLPALVSGSQPDPAQHPVNSQATDVPMTQPDRGAFGNRLGPKVFKKRRTMGF